MLACRACRRALAAAEGCAICAPVKANLVTTEENAEEYPALSDVGSETVAVLQTILREHKKVVRDRDEAQDVRLAAQSAVIKVANTIAKMLESARKLQTDGLAAVRNMNFQDRAALFADWYQSLPPQYRRRVREGQEQFEGQVNQPQPALAQPQQENE